MKIYNNLNLICVLLFTNIYTISCEPNNVCRNYQDYRNMTNNSNCWYNPDIDSSPDLIAGRYGFRFEKYPIKTGDGYFLNIFRIRNKSSNNESIPVLLHHGLLSSAMCFMTAGKRSLAFYLAENGFDVWITNHRGTPYSSGHESYNMTDENYWNFSFHEIALYDVPAIVERITNITGNRSKIIYIGHSMGTTISLIYSSLRKNHAENHLKGLILLAPVASLKYYFSPLRSLLPIIQRFMKRLEAQNYKVLFPYTNRLKQLLKSVCSRFPSIETCLWTIFLLLGPENGELAPADVPVVTAFHPARTSLKVLHHFVQIVTTSRFQYYDYGIVGNMVKYQQVLPPIYPIDKIELPIHMFYGRNDYFAGPQDVNLIYSQLKTKRKTANLIPENGKIGFNHLDFLYGKHMKQYLYKSLMKAIKGLR